MDRRPRPFAAAFSASTAAATGRRSTVGTARPEAGRAGTVPAASGAARGCALAAALRRRGAERRMH